MLNTFVEGVMLTVIRRMIIHSLAAKQTVYTNPGEIVMCLRIQCDFEAPEHRKQLITRIHCIHPQHGLIFYDIVNDEKIILEYIKPTSEV